jgi:hypothetical protein
MLLLQTTITTSGQGGISIFCANIRIKLHLWIDNLATVRYYNDKIYNKYKVHN